MRLSALDQHELDASFHGEDDPEVLRELALELDPDDDQELPPDCLEDDS